MEGFTVELATFIKEVGFPIFVAGFMLINGRKDSKTQTEALNELKIAIVELKSAIKKEGE